MSELIELKQLLSALIGALLALMGRALWERWRKAWIAKRLAVAFWEEMKGVEFGRDAQGPQFAGFSSQTFDTLFSELAESLPDALARSLMQYHWRMKFLEQVQHHGRLYEFSKFVNEAETTWKELLGRLDRYGARSVTRLMLNRAEKWTQRWI